MLPKHVLEAAERYAESRNYMPSLERLQELAREAFIAGAGTHDEKLLLSGLWECLRLSGADVSAYDGFEHWLTMRESTTDLVNEVVSAVRELRTDYFEALHELHDPMDR